MNDDVDPFDRPDVTEAILQRSLDVTPLHVPDLSDTILARFEAEQVDCPPCCADEVIWSLYLDGPIGEDSKAGLTPAQRDTFERHLPQCAPCNEGLGRMHDTLEAYRRHLYRLEKYLIGVDVTQVVLARYTREQQILDESHSLTILGCSVYTPIDWSAYRDQALLPSDAAAMAAHLETCTACPSVLERLDVLVTTLNASMTSLGNRIPESAFDCWSELETRLSRPVLLKLPLERRAVVALGSVAAAVLLMVSVWNPLTRLQPAAPEHVDTIALGQAMRLDAQDQAQRLGVPIQVAYQTPEAYLFSEETEILPPESLGGLHQVDVSRLALND